MSGVAFVTDTISCLPPEILQEYHILRVPTVIIIDGKPYRDMIDLDNDEFWRRFDSMQTFTTAAPSPGDFITAFKEAGKESNDIICTLVSKALSATLAVAVQAAAMLKAQNSPLNIEVMDSRTGTGAEGFIVLEGARSARAGKSKSEVLEVMQDMIKRVKWINAMETSKYLIKIGRAPKTIPTEVFAQIKPMIAMLHNTGLVEDPGVGRSLDDCFQKMVEIIGQNTDTSRPLHINVHYTNNIENGRKLMAMIKAKYNVGESYLTPYSAVMCGTTGPCNAVAFYS
jgi:DegV family protein with EDD domain